MIWAEVPASARQQLEAAARAAATAGLRVTVDHASRWPWALQRPARASVSEDGTCACSLLSDDADWNADFWSMRPEIREALARTLEVLTRQGPAHVTVQALWVGEAAREEVSISVKELMALAAAGQLGTRRRYRVELSAA
jgi:hypothetical protein